MNRRWLLVITAVVLIAAVSFVVWGLSGKARLGTSLPLQVKSGKIVSLSGLLAQAKALDAGGNLLEAKAAYQNLMSEFPGSKDVANWQKRTEDINMRLLFSSAPSPYSVTYEIKPGDTLTRISQEFRTTPELIMRKNGLPSDRIMPGRKIKVCNAVFNIIVDKSQNTLILKVSEDIIKTYTVATGLNNSSPVGTFHINNKLMNPTWFKAGAVVPPDSPENILGSRWLGINVAGYGIHGTTDPQTLGSQVTQGCVRMANTDVEELYAIVPVGTEVTIVD